MSLILGTGLLTMYTVYNSLHCRSLGTHVLHASPAKQRHSRKSINISLIFDFIRIRIVAEFKAFKYQSHFFVNRVI
jgi:hypothetical protein